MPLDLDCARPTMTVHRLIEVLVCTALASGCVLLAILVSASRAYAICGMILVSVYVLRLWRLLPSERVRYVAPDGLTDQSHTRLAARTPRAPVPVGETFAPHTGLWGTAAHTRHSPRAEPVPDDPLSDSRSRYMSWSAASLAETYYPHAFGSEEHLGVFADPMRTRAPLELLSRPPWQGLTMPVPSPTARRGQSAVYVQRDSLVSEGYENPSLAFRYPLNQPHPYVTYARPSSNPVRSSDATAFYDAAPAAVDMTAVATPAAAMTPTSRSISHRSSRASSGYHPSWGPVGMTGSAWWSRSVSYVESAGSPDTASEEGGMTLSPRTCPGTPLTPPPALSFTDLPIRIVPEKEGSLSLCAL